MEVIFFVDPPGQEVVDWNVLLLIILGMYAIVFLCWAGSSGLGNIL